ncbi:response regulator transcription factor [Cohnella zeiphila]|uniref:Response regulator n=1 Tax=Cohnella zeiphila TaxID=2761120 RepID=A0A7X0SLX6_9BACL|nr:response regulator [Cohnella zeiphila]MBB6730158.1 response regulator [Cohnella zeiphila]
MYTILLVDDEKLELDAIARYIRWEDMGISVVGTARNGREALRMQEELRPDIVLTDVRMPIMDGLEFARKAKQFDKNVKVVFLSGHDEFQYIKAALTMEAMGYLLKPIDKAELAQLMERVIRKCEEDKQLSESAEGLKEKLVRSLAAESSAETRKEWVRRIAMLPRPLPPTGDYIVCLITWDEANDRERADVLASLASGWSELNGSNYMWEADERRFGAIAYLDGDSGTESVWRFWGKALEEIRGRTGIVLTIGLSTEGRYLEQLPELWGEAREANAAKFYEGTGTVLPYEAEPRRETAAVRPAAVAERLGHAVAHLQTEAMEAELAGFFAPFRKSRTRREAVIADTMQLATEISRRFSPLLERQHGAEAIEPDWRAITEPQSLAQLQATLADWCRRMMDRIREKDHDKNLPIIHRIRELIDARFSEALTVEELAAGVYLSPNYIRTLFKEKTGQTILEYMTKVRIDRASGLLRNKSLKIHEIAKAVGYENVSYFCSLFQKHRGVTPNEYRKKLL